MVANLVGEDVCLCEVPLAHAKKAYTDALKEGLPENLRAIVARQSDKVIEAHDQVRDLRDRYTS